MTAYHLKLLFVALFTCLFLFQTKAHPQEKEIPLRDALKQVTKAYGTQFVFDPKLLEGKTTNYHPSTEKNKQVEDVLKTILYSELVFLYIKPNYYSIVSKERIGEYISNSSPNTEQRDAIVKTPSTVEKKLSGTITDEKGTALPGANVRVKGTNNITITDENGRFSIEVHEDVVVLVVTSLGYADKEVRVDDISGSLTITLQQINQSLGEVIVVGYGRQKKSDLTGSVASVGNKELMQRPALNAEQTLAGKIAGVNVATNSGRPGGRTRISIRGFSSINATNDPLYIVDGIVAPEGISNIDPNNIESISVLKDASSTAIYGTRGANGVIIVTTQRGRKIGSQISYNGYMSTNWLPSELEVLNSKEFMAIEEAQYQNAEKYDPAGFAAGKYKDPVKKRMNYLVGNNLGNHELFTLDANGVPQPIYDIDWQKMATRTAISNNHNLSFTGGDKQTNCTYHLITGQIFKNS